MVTEEIEAEALFAKVGSQEAGASLVVKTVSEAHRFDFVAVGVEVDDPVAFWCRI